MYQDRLRTENSKKNTAERTWLLYFNDVLFEKGLITEQDKNKMANEIKSHKSFLPLQ